METVHDEKSASMALPDAGVVGPRLSGRLTSELIFRSPQYMSCIKLYHLDLRGARQLRPVDHVRHYAFNCAVLSTVQSAPMIDS